jgi:acyl-coenzyme A thioesterase PaaI-like protein
MTQETGRAATQATGAEIITQFLAHSPFVLHLGMRLELIEADRARLAMPYRDELATIGDVVHGGALAALGLSVDLVAAARGREVVADARVIRRGKSLCFCDVDVTDADGGLVAKGIVTYKLG